MAFLKEIVLVYFAINLCSGRLVKIDNLLKEDLTISATGLQDFVLPALMTKNITLENGLNTIYGTYKSCNVSECREYVTKVNLTIGHLASNMDLQCVDVKKGFNLPMKVEATPDLCLLSLCGSKMLVSMCDEEDLVIINNVVMGCKNNNNSIVNFNVECGKLAVTSDYKSDNIQKCVNIEYYTVTFAYQDWW
ncbi:unnamed protein product [Brassicogethes aeneus]|uniref:Uncharacterized protein n=1 Tax=Brassicogethes aeneus TaxID=1431903 RepID=A0A9P0FA56_BRAAE|nr:unnamed protein product [Brassicogethes aeneus]